VIEDAAADSQGRRKLVLCQRIWADGRRKKHDTCHTKMAGGRIDVFLLGLFVRIFTCHVEAKSAPNIVIIVADDLVSK
jgi:hypothetical protein